MAPKRPTEEKFDLERMPTEQFERLINDPDAMFPVTATQLAEFWDVTLQAVCNWSGRDGCPRMDDGRFNLADVWDWKFSKLGDARCPHCRRCVNKRELVPMTERRHPDDIPLAARRGRKVK